MPWSQIYDPFNNAVVSTLAAALPIVVLLGTLGSLRIKAHYAALLGLSTASAIALLVFRMPAGAALAAAANGAAFGLLPIGWIILNVLFLYQLTVENGLFKTLQESLTSITPDRRLQLLLITFCLGSFFEGAAGMGAPVAITATILIGLGFPTISAAGLALIANTTPVAFGSVGTAVIILSNVTGLDLYHLSAMTGRQLAFFAFIVPFWLIWVFAGFKGMLEIFPALLATSIAYAIPQILVSNFHGPWLVNVAAGIVSMITLILFLRFWKPKHIWRFDHDGATSEPMPHTSREVWRAWRPWVILSLFVFIWGLPQVISWLDRFSTLKIAVPGLHNMILRVAPVVTEAQPQPAIYTFNWLSTIGSGILIAAILAAFIMGYKPKKIITVYLENFKRVRFSLLTIAAMLALGYVVRYSGMDATLGLAFARAGALYPFFSPLLGWLGVAITGSDASSNVLFGSLQKITADQLGFNAEVMTSANGAGGVMGKMISPQSIVIASTATHSYGQEGSILRYVFFHSVGMVILMGVLILLIAYVPPFTLLAIK